MVNRSAVHIPSLDGIRAIAAMLVFVAHAGLENWIPGGFGVTIFFFLSGYLITTLLRSEFESTGRINLKGFYLRRLYRIWPPMYIVLAVDLIPPQSVAHSISSGAVLAQCLHFTNYYIIFHGYTQLIPSSAPMWSLAVEEHFYVVYPLLLMCLMRTMDNRRASLWLLIVCVLVFIWRLIIVYVAQLPHEYTYLASDTRCDSMLYGCILALVLNPALNEKGVLTERQWCQILLASIAVLSFTFIYRDANFRETFRYSVQGLALFPIFFCAVRYSDWAVFRWLQLRWIRRFGVVTYSFYLVHWKALDVAGLIVGNSVLRGCLGFAISLAFSSVMYQLIERRLAALRLRLRTSAPAA